MAAQRHAPRRTRNGAHLRLVERLRQQAGEVRRLTAGLEERALTSRPETDTWSLKELVAHLSRVQQVFASRVETMLAHDNPALDPYSPENDPGFQTLVSREATGLIAAFLRERGALVRRLELLGPSQWRRKARHPEFATYDVHFQIEYMLHHEAHHIYQMFVRRVPLGKLPR